MDRRVCRIGVAICIVSLIWITVDRASAVTINTWDGTGAGDSWGTAMNWDGNQLPTADDIVLFNDDGSIFTPGLVTNALDVDRTVDGLIYQNTTDKFHTTDLGGFSLTVSDLLTANSNFIGTTTVTIENGNLVVGTLASPADLLVGQRTISGDTYSASLDLSDVGSLTADLSELKVGVGVVTGNLKLAVVNVIDANTIVIGASGDAGLHLGQTNTILADDFIVAKGFSDATVDIVRDGTLTLGAMDNRTFLSIADQNFNASVSSGTGRVDLTGGTFNAYLDGLIVGRKLGGAGNTTGELFAGNAGSVSIGDSGNTANMFVGYSPNGNTVGTVDFVGLDSFDANLNQMLIGVKIIGTASGTVTLASTNVIDANTIVVGDGATGVLHLGLSNTILANDFIVAKNFSNSTVDIVNGGTLNLGTMERPTFLSIADQDINTNSSLNGRVDLTGGNFNAYLNGLVVGRKFGGPGTTTGELLVGGSGSVTVGESGNTANMFVGYSVAGGTAIGTVDFGGLDNFTANLNEMLIGARVAGSANGNVTLARTNAVDANRIVVGDGATGVLHLGQSNTILANEFVVAKDFSNATVDIASGGTLNLGTMDRRTFLSIADQDINTNSSLNGRVDLTGGNFNAYLNGLVVGRKFGGPGFTTGELLAGNGGSVTIGDTGNTADMLVGRSVAGGTAIGTVDFGGLDSFTANLNRMLIGTRRSGAASGTVTLAAANAIDANSIVVGDGGGATLHLGQTNDILVGDLLIGGSSSTGLVDIPNGGTLNLGTPDRRTSLTIGKGITNTNSTFTGTLDLAGGKLIAYLDQVIVGEKDANPGFQNGNLFISNQPDNFIDANSIFIGGTKATGTVDFGGGTMAARVIERGNGTAIFNWLGGTLHVDRFGSPAKPFNLANNGLGTLAPGTSAGLTEVWGNYTQSSGATMQIELGGTAPGTQYDQVHVSGSASLAGALDVSLIDTFVPGTPDPIDGGDGDRFTILTADPIIGSFNTVTGLDYDAAVETGRELRLAQTSTDITLNAFQAAYGDGNMDGQLDSTDLFAILAGGKFNHPELGPATWLEGDFSGDDLVNSTDLFLMLSTGKYNQGPYTTATPPAALTTVPEPSSFVLATFGLLGLLAFARQRRAATVM